MSRNPWAAYWAKGGDGASGAPGAGGCLPQADETIAPVLDKVWRDFAAALRPKARVIDLATGDGTVLRRLKAARSGLDLVGVDSAPSLPPAPAGIRLMAGVEMESLPFRDATFDAATSQFGIEYGDPAGIADELARVLKAGAAVRFVVHHAASQIVVHNRARRRALAWAAQESGLVDKARRLAQARAAAALPTPAAFRAGVSEARSLFPDQPVAAEFAAAIVQTLDLGRGRPPGEAVGRLDALAARAADEMGRIAALEMAARDEARIGAIAMQFGASGIGLNAPAILEEQGGGPLAWLLAGKRN
jgi:ubiquinone/menaquinone biosynthesis C-methylase UbiE